MYMLGMKEEFGDDASFPRSAGDLNIFIVTSISSIFTAFIWVFIALFACFIAAT